MKRLADIKLFVIVLIFNLIIITIPMLARGYITYILFRIFTFIVLAVAWNLVSGMTGHVSLGHGVFLGVGTYITAVMWQNGYNAMLGVLLGGLSAVIVALLLTPVFRLKGASLAIGTLALNLGMMSIFVNIKEFGGSGGLHLPIIPQADVITYYLMYVLAFCVFVLSFKIAYSRYGLAIKALSNEDAAQIIGMDTFRVKTGIFLFSALFFGLAGGINTLNTTFISPYTAFDVMWSVYPCFMAILGGIGTLVGPMVGAIAMTFFAEMTSLMVREIDRLIYGITLIILILLLPEGIVPRVQKVFMRAK